MEREQEKLEQELVDIDRRLRGAPADGRRELQLALMTAQMKLGMLLSGRSTPWY